jgi:hypothetical protein
MSTTNNAFVVKNGLVVNGNLITANNGQVGINNSSPDANVTITGTANVQGNVTITTTLTTPNVYATFVNATANVTAPLHYGNVIATYVNASSNVITTNVYATTVNASSNVVTTNVYATTVNATANVQTVNVYATTVNATANVQTATLFGNVIATTVNASSNVIATNVYATTVNASANVVTGNLIATTVNATANVQTVNVYATTVNATANIQTNTVYATNVTATNISGNISGNIVATVVNASANIGIGTIGAASNGVLITNAYITIGNTSVYTNVTSTNGYFGGNVTIVGSLTVTGTTTTACTASATANLTPSTSLTYYLGNSGLYWAGLYVGNVVSTNVYATTVNATANVITTNVYATTVNATANVQTVNVYANIVSANTLTSLANVVTINVISTTVNASSNVITTNVYATTVNATANVQTVNVYATTVNATANVQTATLFGNVVATVVNASSNIGIGTIGSANGFLANTTVITIGNSQVSATINSTTFSGTSANATLLNGQLGSYYTTATNITSGTLPWAQAPAGTVNTSGAFTFTGVQTYSAQSNFNANVSFGTSTFLYANGVLGSSQVLTSNATGGVYWSTVASSGGSVTSITAGNGLTASPSSPITTSGTLSVSAANGISVLSTGVTIVGSTSIFANTTGIQANVGWIAANNAGNFSNATNGLGMNGTASNANTLLNYTWNSPGQIGLTTANTGAFTTLSASGLTTHTANISMGGNYITSPGFQAYKEFVNAITISITTQTLDFSTTNIYNLTLASSTTLTFTNPSPSGTAYSVLLYCKQDATGSRVITWPASVKWPNGSAPTMSTTANKVDVFSFFTLDGGTTYLGALSLANTG